MAETRYKKLTVNISPELHEELQKAADDRGITVTELIRRAIALDKFVYDNRDGELLMKRGSDVKQIVLV